MYNYSSAQQESLVIYQSYEGKYMSQNGTEDATTPLEIF